jgi:hypothetical protein
MVAKINADTSGGLKITSDTSGTLEIQSAGTTKFTVNSAGVDIPAIGTIDGLTSINGGQVGGRRNIVINGEMKLAQRSASVAGLGSGSGYFSLDRYRIGTNAASAGRFTMAQVADGPAGFANCLKLTVTTADTSIAAGERLIITQRFEGQDVQQLKKGTASAEQVTVSFWVKGNAAALYVCELFDSDNLRSITQSFAVTTSWNRIELTFAADTSDPLNDDNGNSLEINFWLHGGSTFTGGTFAVNTWNDYTEANRYAVADRTSIFDATSRTFFLTGVQMEIGSTATDFESRSYGEELALCQRYYWAGTWAGGATADDAYSINILGGQYPTTFRTTPTVTIVSGSMTGHHGIAPTSVSTNDKDNASFTWSGSGYRTIGSRASVTFNTSAEL